MQNPHFICPLCQSPLYAHPRTWQCQGVPDLIGNAKKHSFDVAKQGYINLLPVQFKKSKQPGDSEASILARQRFLQQGYYAVLANALTATAKQLLAERKSPIWLDIGCGEGYYSAQFLALKPNHLIAMDISKPAVIATAKRLKNPLVPTTCLVATVSQMPLADGSVDVISSIFSPILPKEFARLLSKKGIVILAKPLPNHLIELRQGLFETVQTHDSDKFIGQMAAHFALQHQQQIHAKITVDSEALTDLMTMTPYAYRAALARRQAVISECQQQGKMQLSVAFVIYGFIKNA